MKFLAHRKALGTGYVGKDGVRFSKVASQSKLRARQPTPMPSAAPSQRSSRQPSGYGSRQPTARGVGSQDPNRAKWDIDTHRTTYRAPSTQRSFPPDTPLGDQEWFEQFGFSGAVSEEKARDYGNGVPMWSPYFRNPKDYVKQPLSGLAPDAYWFEQYGFRGEEVVRGPDPHSGLRRAVVVALLPDGGPKNVAESLAVSRAEPVAHYARGVGGLVILSSVHYAGRRLIHRERSLTRTPPVGVPSDTRLGGAKGGAF